MKCKGVILFATIICMMLCLCCCGQENFRIKEESYFSDFKIEEGKVYFNCVLVVDNLTGKEKNVILKASFEDDVKNGLLKETLLDGYATDGSTKDFELQKGENRFDVVFIGEHAGGTQKNDRTLPDIKIEEK